MNIKYKYIVILSILLQMLSSCLFLRNNYSNTHHAITYIKEYNVKGIVFSDTTEFPFPNHMYPENFKKRITPTVDEILLFEKVFHEDYEDYRRKQDYHNPTLKITGKAYKKWGRHYFGYIDEHGQIFLLIYFTKLESKREWKNWQQGPFVQFPGQWSIFFNLETNELLGWSDINK